VSVFDMPFELVFKKEKQIEADLEVGLSGTQHPC